MKYIKKLSICINIYIYTREKVMTPISVYVQPKERITTYITSEQATAIDLIAKKTNIHKADVIRESLNEYIKKQEFEDSFINDMVNGFKSNTMVFEEFIKKCLEKDGNKEIFPTQIELAETLETYNRVIIKKSRQVGVTSMINWFAIHKAATPKSHIKIYTWNESHANLLIDCICGYIPLYERLKTTKKTKRKVEFSNESTIEAMPIYKENINFNLYNHTYIFDEYAFHGGHNISATEHLEKLSDDIIKAYTKNRNIIVNSTPTNKYRITPDNEIVLTHFYKLWVYATNPDTPVRAVKITTNIKEWTKFITSNYQQEVNGEPSEFNKPEFVHFIGEGK